VTDGGVGTSPSAAQPTATLPGSWQLIFEDTFEGTSLNTRKWAALEGYNTNGVTTRANNVSVANGNLVLTLTDGNNGAEIITEPYAGATPDGYMLRVGDYVEARVRFPGNGTDLYNWPAWWTSGPDWPTRGEHDIAEVLGGDLTVNYHYGATVGNQTAANQRPNPPGYWGGAFHVYGIYRAADHAEVWWDGVKVHSYATQDNGLPESLIFNVGAGLPAAYGSTGALLVDYVRAWTPA
jgi:hypothetical protein